MASTILIVEDNEVNRLFLVEILRARGFFTLVCAVDGREALKKLDACRPDIVLLDVMLPGGMDGFECCELIRKSGRHADLPILMQTVITEPELRAKAFRVGATDFVSKPLYPEELCARVMVHLEKSHSLRALRFYRARVEAELESARQLQLSILPTADDIEDTACQSRLDIAAHFEPCSEIGGDFWGFKNLSPRQTALWLVDFSGHGVAAALNAFRLQAYLKEHSSLATRPGEYMSLLNDGLLQLLMRGQFAAMFYGVVDPQARKLFYSGACLPNPVILRAETGKAEAIDSCGPPLGVNTHFYPTQTVSFRPGDTLVVASDGLTEIPSSSGMPYSTERIMALLERCRDKSARDILAELIMESGHNAAPPRDDLTVVVCRFEADQAER